MSSHHKLEYIQCNACLAITGAIRGTIAVAIRGTSKEKLSQELGLESLQLRRWYRKLRMFYKIYKYGSPQYLFKLIPEKTMHMLQETLIKFPILKLDATSSKTFFPSTIIECNYLGPTLQNSKSFVEFKNSILKFIGPSSSNVFNCDNYKGIRLITRLRVGMSHLREHNLSIIFKIV